MRKVLLFAVMLSMFGCDEGGGSSKAQGTEGGACYPNGTCNDGLECVNDVCSSGNVNNTNNTNNTNNVNNANPGELGGACLEGDLCNEGLVCSETICKADADGDGYPSDNDCDDNDENAYPGAILECQSDCAYGTKACNSAGEWTECTADTECTCTTPGETKDVPCGKCGTASVMCTADLVWEFPTNCQNEGECHPWEAGQQDCGFCGHQERACDSTCHWEDWSECSDQGECEAGVNEWTTDDCTPLGFIQQRECTNSCEWNVLQTCTDQCIGQARVGSVDASGMPDYKDEVCIPGGAFIRGDDNSGSDENKPQGIVYLSPYYIDIYEVTNARYRECVDSGVCTAPAGGYYYDDPEKGNYPVEAVTKEQALQFCAWDGSRTLPTEAMWEKAAKGPYPEQKIYPWGNTNHSECTYNIHKGCFFGDNSWDYRPGPVDYTVDGISYYGLFSMLGNAIEWTYDLYDVAFYSNGVDFDPISLIGTKYPTRGTWFKYEFDSIYQNINHRAGSDIDLLWGFRCARPTFTY